MASGSGSGGGSGSSSELSVIDLTADDGGPSIAAPEPVRATSFRASRPPRFNHEIIDLADDSQAPIRIPDSPEVEFISARTLDPPRQPPRQRFHLHSEIDLTDEDFDFFDPDPQEGGVNAGHPTPGNAAAARFVNMNLRDILRDGGGFFGALPNLRRAIERNMVPEVRGGRILPPRIPRRRPDLQVVEFNAPDLDFDVVGFDMGLPRQRTATPTYKAPEAAPEGFTRSPAEDDVLVCPNCGDELCVGDSDLKKQVWILKACGHVYCGDCAQNRTLASAKKRKEKMGSTPRPKPFKICTVDGCDKKCVARTSMIQVFL